MIYILTALYAEARPIIERYSFQKIETPKPLCMYEAPEHDMRLIVTGVGPVQAAAAIGALGAWREIATKSSDSGEKSCDETVTGNGIDVTKDAPNTRDCLINIGLCAGKKIGKMYLANKIVNVDSGRTFYPDMVVRSGLSETTVMTVSRIVRADPFCEDVSRDTRIDVREEKMESVMGKMESVTWRTGSRFAKQGKESFVTDLLLYDTEAAAIYEAGSSFFGPHQMSFLKIVSDSGCDHRMEKSDVSSLITENLPQIDTWIEAQNKAVIRTKHRMNQAKKLSEDLHCSVTMQHELNQLLKYAYLIELDIEIWIATEYKKGNLPCKDRRAGKKFLENLKNTLQTWA